MEHGYAWTHRLVVRLFDSVISGRSPEWQRMCRPDATWWLPQRGGDRLAPTEAGDRIARMLGEARSAVLNAVVVAPDGGQAVAEVVATGAPGSAEDQATNVTTVLAVVDGHITEAHTYFDVAAWV